MRNIRLVVTFKGEHDVMLQIMSLPVCELRGPSWIPVIRVGKPARTIVKTSLRVMGKNTVEKL